MYNYEVGKQVVCISKTNNPWKNYYKTAAFNGCPHPGQILTIRSIKGFDDGEEKLLGLQFFELSVKAPNGNECWFQAKEFRPVKKTDISELVKLTKELQNT